MQPARMKKIQSLDYASAPPSAGLANKTGPDCRQPVVAGSHSASGRPNLLHSVSIVVDLATTSSSASASSTGAQLGSCGSTSSHGSTSGSNEEAPIDAATSGAQPASRQASEATTSPDEGADFEMFVRSAPMGSRLADSHKQRRGDEADRARSNYGKGDDNDYNEHGDEHDSDNEDNNEEVDDGDEDEADDDEEEDDMEACLSSQLARRVVLVDEADKIFMRNRAQSAEPQVLHKSLADFYSRPTTPKPLTPSEFASIGPASAATCVSSTTASRALSPSLVRGLSRRPRHSVASFSAISDTGAGRVGGPATQSSHSSLARPGDTYQGGGSVGLGSAWSELAEHGELNKLSMRRNTHHNVNFPAPTAAASGVAGDTPGSGPSTTSATTGCSQALVMRSSGQAHLPFDSTSSSSNSPARQPFAPLGGGFSQSSALKQPSSRYFQIDNQHHHQQQQQQQQQKYSAINQFSSAGRFPAYAATSQGGGQRKSAAGLVVGPYRAAGLRQQPQPAIQHRRQSLQISLLSGSCRDTSRSLTEEELRGEREFNEQVRCAARSPEFGTLLSHYYHNLGVCKQQQQQQHLKKLVPKTWASSDVDLELDAASSARATSGQVTQQARCHSTSGTFRPVPVGDPLIDAAQHEQQAATTIIEDQQHLRLPSASSATTTASGARRRRVSFGSIDPIVLDRGSHDDRPNWRLGSSPLTALDPFAAAGLSNRIGASTSVTTGAAHNKRQRASICDPLGVSGAQQYQTSQLRVGSGILKKLERCRAQSPSSVTTSTASGSCQSPPVPALVAFSLGGREIEAGDKRQPQSASARTTSDKQDDQGEHQASGRRCTGDDSTKLSQAHGTDSTTVTPTKTTTSTTTNCKKTFNKTISSKREEMMMTDESKATSNSSSIGADSHDLSPATTPGSTGSATRMAGNACSRRTRLASVGGEPVFVTTTTSATTPTKVQHQEDGPGKSGGRQATNLHARRHQSMSIGPGEGGLASGASERDDNRVQSIMANAKLRQEEFARLLEEHEQIVNEINRFETEISTAAAAAGQQQHQIKLDLAAAAAANKERANQDEEQV